MAISKDSRMTGGAVQITRCNNSSLSCNSNNSNIHSNINSSNSTNSTNSINSNICTNSNSSHTSSNSNSILGVKWERPGISITHNKCIKTHSSYKCHISNISSTRINPFLHSSSSSSSSTHRSKRTTSSTSHPMWSSKLPKAIFLSSHKGEKA
mmetsp:Transcript_81578/g.170660  ORF Transcript_81578/g.170660 Transcript_81578/m.170660 type:complete len:153 (+) Transcript_81578:115-573(+)